MMISKETAAGFFSVLRAASAASAPTAVTARANLRLAKKAEYLAGADLQVDVLVCLHRAETLADAAKLDIHEDRLTKNSRCPGWYGGSGSVA